MTSCAFSNYAYVYIRHLQGDPAHWRNVPRGLAEGSNTITSDAEAASYAGLDIAAKVFHLTCQQDIRQ